ncbi:TPA: hypothetical protein DEO28_01555 [Candidatus Dependentiae bacterium]|nr:MAG: Protease HtpX-like protein [candidate division TM6 bacterium GW2011_GWE2_31_21]KKP52920.1 MAG: Protease HtpX-like protein [candidate division TM6 bacterium GW2011_GWF2_33_332]HBS47839.1 hypothetical protein [Candidatus Dependentiae bacterium]HBZ73185.1 hypothetical protein [Candidatus Dependentiae bacterium]
MKKLFLLLFLAIFTTKVLPDLTETIKNQNAAPAQANPTSNNSITTEQKEKLEEFKKLFDNAGSFQDKAKMIAMLYKIQDELNDELDYLTSKNTDVTLVTEKNDSVLYNLIKEMALKLEIPIPLIFSIKSEKYDACAENFDKNLSIICITEALRKAVTIEELKSVMAHELAHIKYGHSQKEDFLINSLIAGSTISIFVVILLAAKLNNVPLKSLLKLGLTSIIGGAAVAAPALASFMYVSRKCETEADTLAAKTTNPDSLATALNKLEKNAYQENAGLIADKDFFIEAYEQLIKALENEKISSLKKGLIKIKLLYLKNKFQSHKEDYEEELKGDDSSGILDTHPATKERIKNIEQIKKEKEAETAPAIAA